MMAVWVRDRCKEHEFMRLIYVITAWDGNQDALAKVSMPNILAYCHRHNYGLIQARNGERHPCWWKVKAVEQALAEIKPDWAVWLDIDLWITNHTTKLEYWMSLDHDFVCSYDKNGLNAGVLFFRNTEWTRQLLERWWETDTHGCVSPEQSALAYCLPAMNANSKWCCRPQKEFNAYDYSEYGYSYASGQWEVGDFILHMPGVTNERRIERFTQLRDRPLEIVK
jgi:hypothetical protein